MLYLRQIYPISMNLSALKTDLPVLQTKLFTFSQKNLLF